MHRYIKFICVANFFIFFLSCTFRQCATAAWAPPNMPNFSLSSSIKNAPLPGVFDTPISLCGCVRNKCLPAKMYFNQMHGNFAVSNKFYCSTQFSSVVVG